MTALYAVAFLSSLGFSIVIPFMGPLVVRLGGNAFVLGAVGASFWSAQLVGSAWLGALSDRIGRKRVLFRSQLGAMAAWLLFLAALNVAPIELVHADRRFIGTFVLTLPLIGIAFARVADGLFNGSISVANAYVADLSDQDARKLGYARLGAASSLGFVVGPAIAGLLARTDLGVNAVVVLAFVLSGAAAVLIRRHLPALQPRSAAAVEVARRGGVHMYKPLGGGCADAVRHPRWRVRAILAQPELRPLMAIYFLTYLAFSMFTAAFPVHAVVDLGWSTSRLSLLYAALAMSLAMTEALLLPRLTRRLATPGIAAGGSMVLISAYLLMSRSSGGELLLGGVLYGLGNGLSWPSFLAMLAQAGPPELQGAVQGLGGSAGSLASIVGTLTGGVLYVTQGVAVFYIAAATIAVTTWLFVTAAWRARPARP